MKVLTLRLSCMHPSLRFFSILFSFLLFFLLGLRESSPTTNHSSFLIVRGKPLPLAICRASNFTSPQYPSPVYFQFCSPLYNILYLWFCTSHPAPSPSRFPREPVCCSRLFVVWIFFCSLCSISPSRILSQLSPQISTLSPGSPPFCPVFPWFYFSQFFQPSFIESHHHIPHFRCHS